MARLKSDTPRATDDDLKVKLQPGVADGTSSVRPLFKALPAPARYRCD